MYSGTTNAGDAGPISISVIATPPSSQPTMIVGRRPKRSPT